MSTENVEIVRRMIETFNTGGIEAAVEFLDPEVEFHEPPEQPAPRVAHGACETREMFAAFDAAWEEHRSEPEEIRSLGGDDVLVLSIERFRGRDGIEVAQRAGTIVSLRDGRLFRWRAFWDQETALAAAASDAGA
ncbi:MAG: nuclear transport factor 2 family protein [Vicinamibacteria bacterium]